MRRAGRTAGGQGALLQNPREPRALTLGWGVRGERIRVCVCQTGSQSMPRLMSDRTKRPFPSGQGPASSSHPFLNKQSPRVTGTGVRREWTNCVAYWGGDPQMAGDLPGAEPEPGVSLLMAPEVSPAPSDESLPSSPGWGLVHLNSDPLQGIAPSLLEVLPGSDTLEEAKGNSGGGASRESWGSSSVLEGARGWACPECRIPHTRPGCQSVPKLRAAKEVLAGPQSRSRRQWAWAPGTRPSVHVELAWLGPGAGEASGHTG